MLGGWGGGGVHRGKKKKLPSKPMRVRKTTYTDRWRPTPRSFHGSEETGRRGDHLYLTFPTPRHAHAHAPYPPFPVPTPDLVSNPRTHEPDLETADEINGK